MKRCIHCCAEKLLTEFYAHPSMADGHLGSCKECHRARVRQNRAAKITHYRAYDRQRYDCYARTPLSVAESAARRAARVAVSNAVRDGRLLKNNCQHCGDARAQGHHPDYGKPLEVIWLCNACHRRLHRSLKAAHAAQENTP